MQLDCLESKYHINLKYREKKTSQHLILHIFLSKLHILASNLLEICMHIDSNIANKAITKIKTSVA